jgi:shikimate kinase
MLPTSACVSLIGMPGAGKTTVGRYLSELLGLGFRDTDDDLEHDQGLKLEEIIQAVGPAEFRVIEERVITAIPFANEVIATGGSVIYSHKIMAQLRQCGPIVYLDAPLSFIEERISANPPRGIAKDQACSIDELYRERTPLYLHWADLRIDCSDASESPARLAHRIVSESGTLLSADTFKRDHHSLT